MAYNTALPVGTIDAVNWGADPTGSADSTTALTAAHATGKVVYYRTGNYKVSGTIALPAGGIIGDGYGLTSITSTDTSTADAFSCSGVGSYVFKDFLLLGPRSGGLPVKTAGSGINISPAVVNNNTVIDNVSINGFPISALMGNTTGFVISGSFFEAWTSAGVSVNDTTNADGGDSVITGSTFATSATTGVGVAQRGSGGLKIAASKFNGGAYGYQLNNIQGNTGDLIIEGCSLENMTTAGILLSRSSGSFTFFNVNIAGNQIANTNVGISIDGSGAITDMAIVGNIIQATAGASPVCIGLNSGSNIIVSGNRLSAQPSGGTIGILIGAGVTNTKIGTNFFTSVQSYITNNATSPTVTLIKDTQAGTVVTSAAGWGGYGGSASIFQSATIAVTFPVPFNVAPSVADISFVSNGGNGVIGGAVTVLSATGMSFVVISAASGVVASVGWRVAGIL